MFEFKKAGDAIIIKGDNFEYKRVGDLTHFKQEGRVPSLRVIKTAIKHIEKSLG